MLSACGMKYGFTSAGFFFQLGNHSILRTAQISSYVSDTAVVQSLGLNLFLHSWFPCVVAVFILPHSLQRQRCVPFSLRPFLTRSSAPQCRHLISIYCFIMTEQYTKKNYRSTDLTQHPTLHICRADCIRTVLPSGSRWIC